jgi:hypothetical protein
MSRFTIRRLTLPTAVFLAAAAVGWVVGGGGEDGQAADGGPGHAESRPTRTARPFRNSPGSAIPSHCEQRLAVLRAARTPEDRWLASIHLARSLPVSEMEAWFDGEWFGDYHGMEENLFYRVCRARWLEEDPGGLLDYCLLRNSRHIGDSLGQWARRDPEGAMEWFEQLGRVEDRRKLMYSFGEQLAKENPTLALERVMGFYKDAGNNRHALDQMITVLAAQAGESLKLASKDWPRVLQNSADRALARADLQRDFQAGLERLQDHPQGRKLFAQALSSGELEVSVLDFAAELPEGWMDEVAQLGGYSLVRKDPERWLEADLAALGVGENAARNLRTTAANILAQKDPKSVLVMVSRGEFGEQERLGVLTGALRALAARDADGAREWIAQLSNPREVEVLERAIEDAMQGRGSMNEQLEPKELLEMLADSSKREDWWRHYHRTMNWGGDEERKAREDFAALPDEQKAGVAAVMTSHGSSYGGLFEFRADALSFMLAHPPADDGQEAGQRRPSDMIATTSKLATQWVAEDPVAAADWVRCLPAGEERSWATKNLAVHWAEYEPTAAAAWVRTLPKAERAELEKVLGNPGGEW